MIDNRVEEATWDDLEDEVRAYLSGDTKSHVLHQLYAGLHSSPPLNVGHSQWVIAGYQDVLKIMASPSAVVTTPLPVARSPVVNELLLDTLPYTPSGEHRRLRAVIQPLISPKVCVKVTDGILQNFEQIFFPNIFRSVGCDINATTLDKLPLATTCMLLDVPPTDWTTIDKWARTLYGQIGLYGQPPEELHAAEIAAGELVTYVKAWRDGRSTPIAGLGISLIRAWKKAELSDRQLLSIFLLFLLTGRDTLTNALPNALWYLANHPAVYRILRKQPARSVEVFDEVLRLWGPIRICVRQLEESVVLSSQTFPASSLLFLLVHAANRDERQFSEANEFLLGRRKPSRLTFGVGLYGCIGASVARSVCSSLIAVIAGRCESIRATPGFNDVEFVSSPPILGIKDLRLYADASNRSSAP